MSYASPGTRPAPYPPKRPTVDRYAVVLDRIPYTWVLAYASEAAVRRDIPVSYSRTLDER